MYLFLQITTHQDRSSPTKNKVNRHLKKIEVKKKIQVCVVEALAMTQPRGGDQGSFLQTERQDWVLKNVYLAGREENQACIAVWSPGDPQRAWGARRLCERVVRWAQADP